MSFSDNTTWRIIDKDGNELDISEVLEHCSVTIEVREYDPNTSALGALLFAIEDDFDSGSSAPN